MKDYQEALKLLQKHFPDASTSALHEAASMMEVEMPIAGETVSAAMKAESIETVDRIRQGLSAIVADYAKLPQGARDIAPAAVISRLLTVPSRMITFPLVALRFSWQDRF